MNHFYFGNQPDMSDLIIQYEAMSQKGKVSSIEAAAFIKLIDFYETEDSLDKALEVSDLALKQHKFSSELHTKKAKLLIALKKEEQALESLDRAEVFGQSFVEIDLLRAQAWSLMKQHSKALSILIDLRINYYITKDELSNIFVQEAAVYEQMEDYDQMFHALKMAMIEKHDNEDALKRFWLAIELSRYYEESVEFLHQILEIDAYSHQAWFNLGHAYFNLKEYENALLAFEYSILSNEKFQPAYRDYTEVALLLRKYPQALECLEEARVHFDYDDELLLKIGTCYQNMGYIGEAKLQFYKALAQNNKNDELYFHLGTCYALEDQWSSAFYFYKQAIKLNDRQEEYFLGMANAYYQLGQVKKALPLYKKATELAPELSNYWAHLAVFLFEQGEIEAALEVIEESEEHTYGPNLYYCRAACLFRMNQRSKALNALGEGLMEQFENHQLFLDLVPEFTEDKDVKAIIRYYRKTY